MVPEEYRKSGRIAAKCLREVCRIVEPGKKILELCEFAEELIRKEGGLPAFPCNISVNEVAAHYSSPPGDESVIPDKGVVKVDLGVHVDGYITDTAFTVALDPKYEEMVQVAEEALEEGMVAIAPGVRLSEVGKVIERTIKRAGYKPIENLTGHLLSRYVLHAGKSVPNVGKAKEKGVVRAGEVYAIEPFITLPSAKGWVIEGGQAFIYRAIKPKTKEKKYKKLMEAIRKFKGLPFSGRWLVKPFGEDFVKSGLNALVKEGSLMAYPVLIEKSKKVVAQVEATIYVGENSNVILTPLLA